MKKVLRSEIQQQAFKKRSHINALENKHPYNPLKGIVVGIDIIMLRDNFAKIFSGVVLKEFHQIIYYTKYLFKVRFLLPDLQNGTGYAGMKVGTIINKKT
ncbi:hypothetical protein [Marivirga arenosa]|uniref:Uncharacterized protein n=1 Tax=Marivirga arenosa TaxID=3059076 RepID=A0AA51X527_9BACT|nr:hypothetical protein [Marivirga sp. BKB1-2]WNB16849.1 hypothetical protein QYS47_31955 [Marivirga sp. BKB1-2]